MYVEIASQSPQCSAGGVVTGSHSVSTQVGRPQVVLWWDADWGNETYPRGPDPEDQVVSPGSSIRDVTGNIAVWRVPASDDGSLDFSFEGGYSGVPVRLYVVDAGIVTWDQDGNPSEAYLQPVEGVELCTGVVEKLTDADGHLSYTSAVRTTCDTTWTTVAEGPEVMASSDPEDTLENPAGDPETWVPVGLGVGIIRAPEQAGRYALMVEPLTEPFRGGGAWRVHGAPGPDGEKGFVVGGGVFLDATRRPILDEILLGEARDVYVQFSHPGNSPMLTTTVRFEKEGVTQSSASIEASRVGAETGGASLYEGLVHLVTPPGLKRRKVLEDGPNVDGRGSLVAVVGEIIEADAPVSVLAMRINDVVDRDGASLLASDLGQLMFDIKKQGPARVRYEIVGTNALLSPDAAYVRGFIDDANPVHVGFYGSTTGPTATEDLDDGVERIATPNVFESDWEARDRTTHRRILIEGEYELTVELRVPGLDPSDSLFVDESRYVMVGRPNSSNYAPEYWGTDPMNDTNFDDQAVAHSNQETLHDGTGFDRLSLSEGRSDPAGVALDRLAGSDSVMSFVGHSEVTPGVIMFYGYDDPQPVPEHVSWLAPNPEVFPGPPERTAFISALAEDALRDVLFVALIACQTDMYTGSTSNHLPSVMIEKGADLVLAFPSVQDDSGAWVHMAQVLRIPWNAKFWPLATGNEQFEGAFLTIGDAHLRAVQYALSQCPLCTGFQEAVFVNSTIHEAPGVSRLEYLWPARYGNSAN